MSKIHPSTSGVRTDPHATRRLLELITPRVVRIVRIAMGSGHPEADDAVQLTLIGFLRALPSFRGECAPGAFAARIALRTASRLRRRTTAIRGREATEIDPDTLAVAAWDPDVAQRAAAVRALLARLPREQADALTMRVALGFSVREIARTTRAPVETVRSRLRLAKRALRSCLDGDRVLADCLVRP
jgi:RNA polymerase sigma-70 factor (ECF subfamily)